MSNLAAKIDASRVEQEIGEIVGREEADWLVRTAGGVVRARRAVSCLVEPIERDVVLVAVAASAAAWVLSVLERDAAPTRLAVDGDLEIATSVGRVSIAAQHGIDLASPRDVTLVAGALHATAVEGSLSIDTLTMLASLVRAEIERVKASGAAIDVAFDRSSERLGNAYRSVEGLDQVKAGRIEYAAKESLALHGENALVTADELVKIDGEQIHVG